jgi:hypothetical protein
MLKTISMAIRKRSVVFIGGRAVAVWPMAGARLYSPGRLKGSES